MKEMTPERTALRHRLRALRAQLDARPGGAPNPREYSDYLRNPARYRAAFEAYRAESLRLEAEYQRLGREWHGR
mgnify:CR=1 FL=1